MSGAQVYHAISAVASDLASLGVPKSMTNPEEGYDYRSIDALMNRLSPILAGRKLCILPRVLERTATDRAAQSNEVLISVSLKVAFDLVSSEDGSRHSIEVYGEALDRGDKATAKAFTAAYKTAMLQTFCVPVVGTEDPDASAFRLRRAAPPATAATTEAEPPQGWAQWSVDLKDIIAVCETAEALNRAQESNRALLRSLAREQPQLYEDLGKAFSDRRQQIGPAMPPRVKAAGTVRRKKTAPSPKRSKANGAAAPIH
jgi:hypothetical protein